MIVRYGLEMCDACVLGVGIRPILVLAAEFRQRSAIIKVIVPLIYFPTAQPKIILRLYFNNFNIYMI